MLPLGIGFGFTVSLERRSMLTACTRSCCRFGFAFGFGFGFAFGFGLGLGLGRFGLA